MMIRGLLAGLMVLVLGAGSVPGQLGFGSPDVTATPVATGLPCMGDIAVDGQGNVWISAIFNSGAGDLLRVAPNGTTTPFPVTALHPGGIDMVRGQDGNIWYWSGNAQGAILIRLTPAGQIAAVFTGLTATPWITFGRGIAQDAAGGFFLGNLGGHPILYLAPGGTALAVHGWGLLYNRLAYDPAAGILYTNDDWQVSAFPVTPTSGIYGQGITPVPPGFTEIKDHEIGWDGHVVMLVDSGQPYYEIVACREPRVFATIGRIYPTGFGPPAARLTRGLGNDLYVMAGTTLWRLSGRPAILTTGRPVYASWFRIRLDGPPMSPVIVGVDVPGISMQILPFGTFRTSLGTLPTFFVLADSIGAFAPANQAAGTPWATTVTVPPFTLGFTFTAEGYVLTPQAQNGLVKISNAVTETL